MYGGVIFSSTVLRDGTICPLFRGIRCLEVSVNGGSTVVYTIFVLIKTL